MKTVETKNQLDVGPGNADASGWPRRVVVLVVAAALIAVFGIAAPYKTYQYFKARQHAQTAYVLEEEL